MTDDDLREQMMNLSACTLPTAQRPTRLAEFDEFFATGVRAVTRSATTVLELRLSGRDAEPIGRDLAARKSACCSFFIFSFEQAPTGTVMRVEVPGAQIEVLDALAARAESAVAEAAR